MNAKRCSTHVRISGSPGPKRPGDDVGRLADEDRAVAHVRTALDLPDHLGVVVGRQECLPLTALRERQVAHEVGQPRVRRRLELGILVQEVVDLPRLVADPDVVPPLARDVVEEHEVREQDLVHPAQGVEDRQVGARRPPTRCARTRPRARRSQDESARREPRAGPSSAAARASRSRGRAQPTQLARDREVAAGVPEPDRRRDEQGASRHGCVPAPGTAGGAGGNRNSRSSRFTRTGSRRLGQWPLLSSVTSRPPVARRARAPSSCR